MNSDIFKRIEQSKSPDFGDVISKSFDLFKQFFSEGLVHNLVALGVAIPFIILVYVPFIPFYIEMLQNSGDPYYTPTVFEDYGIGIIVGWCLLVFVLSFIMQVVNMSIYGHFLKFLKKNDTGSNEAIGGYFTLLKTHFGKFLLLTLASMGIALLATLLCYLPIFYVMIPLHWLFPILIFNEKLSVGDTVKAAFKYGNKHWGIMFGLGFVASIISSLGIIACYIGIIATMSFTYVATYVTYRDSIGFDTENDE